ncbi:hypothetical protein GGR55DRAFT_252390 [Xylaria sp. FL0064]|nr:hypothetical protein GGR55DRAFT_252390 [Xylaria sp. FL0064]
MIVRRYIASRWCDCEGALYNLITNKIQVDSSRETGSHVGESKIHRPTKGNGDVSRRHLAGGSAVCDATVRHLQKIKWSWGPATWYVYLARRRKEIRAPRGVQRGNGPIVGLRHENGGEISRVAQPISTRRLAAHRSATRREASLLFSFKQRAGQSLSMWRRLSTKPIVPFSSSEPSNTRPERRNPLFPWILLRFRLFVSCSPDQEDRPFLSPSTDLTGRRAYLLPPGWSYCLFVLK